MATRKHDDEAMKQALTGRTLDEAARELGMHPRTLATHKARFARMGWSPEHGMTKTVPDGFHLRGTSTLYDEDGKPKLQWVKTSIDHERQLELMHAAAAAMGEQIDRLAPMGGPAHTDDALCNLYTLTDCHIGEYATAIQGGADWNLEEAERVLVGCFAAMINASAKARYCVINQLGDFLTFDGLEPVTPTNRHPLNVSGIYAELVRVSIKVLRSIIDMALAKHEEVHLVIAEGNHDLAGSLWLRHMFEALYENEPRLKVNMSETPYYVYQHGKTMLGFHHGHKARNSDLPGIFAANFPEIWGCTKHREAHTGHYHKEEVATHNGMIVRRHPTLTATGSYAARLGYASNRRAIGITYHKEYGRVAVNEVVPEMLCA